jgi:glucose/mannose-6-phosphate isomerase
MLDQPDFIARYDKSDSLAVIADQPSQLLNKYPPIPGLKEVKFSNIVLVAMGGSALAAEFTKSWLSDRIKVPFEVVRDYRLPEYVDGKSLVVCYSYSGTTEETISSLQEAQNRGAHVVVMASGGPMLESAQTDGLPFLALPSAIQGRYGVLNGVRAWAELLEALGLVSGLVGELEAAANKVSGDLESWRPSNPTGENEAKRIASELVGHPVVVYGGPVLASLAMKWKVDLNENAKNGAFWNWLPEMNHNELNGWTHPQNHGFKVVELMSSLDNEQVAKRFAAMNKLLSDRFAPITVVAQGESRVEQMVWAFMLGSYVSAYLGILNQVDIGTLPLVVKLKAAL